MITHNKKKKLVRYLQLFIIAGVAVYRIVTLFDQTKKDTDTELKKITYIR